jgi:anti-sigma factor RsiW
MSTSLSRRLRGLMMRTMPLMITCREFDEFLVGYFDGALPAAQRRRFELHLRLCPECRRYLETYRRTLALTRAALRGDELVPEEVPEDLVRAILAARRDHEP